MKHKEILSRAWKILWNYKALWVFGIILALTTTAFPDRVLEFSGSNSNQEREGINIQRGDNFREEFGKGIEEAAQEFGLFFNKVVPEELGQAFMTIAILAGCVIVIFIILAAIFRYVSETSIVRMVDEHETMGTKYTIGKGFRLGFSRSAWRLFLIDLIINIPVFVAFSLLTLLVLSPLLLWTTDNTAASIIGTVAAVGLFFLVVVLAILVGAALSLCKRFFYRTCVLSEMGVIESIKRGYQLVRANLKDVAIMWLLLIGVSFGFSLAMIPVVFLLLAIAAVIAGVLGLSVSGISGIFAGDTQSLVAGLVAGVPIFFLLLVAPLIFLSGLKETFISSSWTLAYREAQTLESLDLEFETEEQLPEQEKPSEA